MIKPTVGRVVWYYPYGKTQVDAGEQPLAALVAHVHGDRCVNLAIFDGNGVPYSKPPTSVTLVQEGDEVPEHSFCTWMPYQTRKAAEELQKQLASKG